MSLSDIVSRIKRGPVGTAPPPPKQQPRVPAPRTRPAPKKTSKPSSTTTSQPKEEDVFVGPVQEDKLSPTMSRVASARTILSSPTLSPEEKKQRIQQVMSGRPSGMTRTEIRATGRLTSPVTMTQPKYFQETYETKEEIGRQKSEYYGIMEGIDPTALYKHEGKLVIGAVLKAKFKTGYLPQLEEAEKQSQLAWSQARDLPSDTTVTKTEEGYEFKFRDTSLDWSKGEFEKLGTLRKEGETHLKSGDIGTALMGSGQKLGADIAEFGFGAVSSFGALLKPIVLDPLWGTEKSRSSHFVSPLDFAFEPVGWSPKGSSELMMEHPIFIAGGAAGEVLQSFAITQAFKPVSAGAKIGAKAIIKRVPGVYAKFTKVFPEEKFLKLGMSGTKKVIAKGGSELPENIYRWGAEGYKKGLKLTSAGVKTTSKEVPGVADDIVSNVTQKTKYGKGGVERIWLSPTDFAKAQDDIAAKLAMKKVIEYSPQSRLKAGVGEVSELFERTKYKLSWSGKRLVKEYDTTRHTWKFGDDVGLAKISSQGDDLHRGFTRFALEGAGEPIESSGWFAIHKKMVSEGFTRTVPTESGHLLESFKGFGSAGFRPMPKKWITGYRPPFIQNIQAQASTTFQGLKTKVSRSSSKVGHRLDLLPNLYTETIPSSIYFSAFSPALDIATIGVIKTISARTQPFKPDIITVPKRKQDMFIIPVMKPEKVTAVGQIQDTFTIPIMKQTQVPMVKMDMPLETVTDFGDEFYKIDVPSPKKPQSPSYATVPSVGFPFLHLPKGLGGSGATDDMFGFTTPISRSRKHKLGDILEELEKGFSF